MTVPVGRMGPGAPNNCSLGMWCPYNFSMGAHGHQAGGGGHRRAAAGGGAQQRAAGGGRENRTRTGTTRWEEPHTSLYTRLKRKVCVYLFIMGSL